LPQVHRLRAEAEARCPSGTKLVVVPRRLGASMHLLVPEWVSAVVVILDDDENVGWVEDSSTGRGIVDFVRPAPFPEVARAV
jgi:hypothetical protein